MTDIPKGATCCKTVHRGWWGTAVCGKKAKVIHNGKFYCGIHDPVRVQEKRDANYATWKAEFEAGRAAAKAAEEKQAAIELDAARYRFLESDFSPMGVDIDGNHVWAYRRNASLKGPTLSAAIDAAMKG